MLNRSTPAAGTLQGILWDPFHRIRKVQRDGLCHQTWPTRRLLCALLEVRAAVAPAFERLQSEVRPKETQTTVDAIAIKQLQPFQPQPAHGIELMLS